MAPPPSPPWARAAWATGHRNGIAPPLRIARAWPEAALEGTARNP
jgi:hypothetical protein